MRHYRCIVGVTSTAEVIILSTGSDTSTTINATDNIANTKTKPITDMITLLHTFALSSITSTTSTITGFDVSYVNTLNMFVYDTTGVIICIYNILKYRSSSSSSAEPGTTPNSRKRSNRILV